ncbi:MAG: hypothetical protein WBO36_06855 [Saprospiraceae bacterium]
MLRWIVTILMIEIGYISYAQSTIPPPAGKETKISLEGGVYSAMITPEGDTLILVDLDNVSITALRTFASDDDYKKYQRFRLYAAKVYP